MGLSRCFFQPRQPHRHTPWVFRVNSIAARRTLFGMNAYTASEINPMRMSSFAYCRIIHLSTILWVSHPSVSDTHTALHSGGV